ncbi:MAG: ABC-F family ATP-binding cassette domain-containing protein, partial [Faecalibacterium prausnitzii]|nr:ABC-F family ATP-binding cassette domain-containing protein [Faecalibacterium prausnitzii]
ADGYNMDVNIKKVLSGMGFAQNTWEKNIAVLSGGELTRLRLAKLLLEKPDVLILDEPTNHLDFATMEWLENYLKSYSGAVLVVSHDRYFLDNVCTKIWEVSFQTMTTYKGNFSAYLPQKEAADALRQKQHDADVALAEKLQDYVDRNLVRASTTKMAQSRRKQLEKLEITEAPKDETNQLKFRFEYDVEPWNELVLLKNLSIKIGERTLLEPFTYTVCRGQRLIIAGPNGAGKSTLMQVLDGKRRPSGGMVRLGTGARPSIFAQQQSRLGQGRVIDVIWNKYPRMTELEVRSHLAKLGFRGETVFKPCEALSGGELARLRFAEIVLERPNLLFLDEPTNHLDIYTRENLTEALMAYTGTLLLVTHDRHLMNSLACPILYLEDGKAVIYPSYDALMGRAAPAAETQKAAEPAKTGYGKEQRRRRAELRAKIKACEDEMEACGAREVELDNEINSPEVYNDPDLLRQKSDELSDLRFHQEELFAQWEAAMEEQEAYEQTQQAEE